MSLPLSQSSLWYAKGYDAGSVVKDDLPLLEQMTVPDDCPPEYRENWSLGFDDGYQYLKQKGKR